MKQRLDQLTLQELIELSCGDVSVLIEHDEVPTVEESSKAASHILAEYKSIASPAQARMDLSEKEKTTKLTIKERCARIAMALCQSGRADDARQILVAMGVGEEHLKTEEAILARCQSILGEVDYERQRMSEYNAKRASKQKSPDHVRHSWYAEIASVMSILKVPVEMRINACVYANLVHQAVERNKAMAKMPPMAGMFM
jgi:hypothetical protein